MGYFIKNEVVTLTASAPGKQNPLKMKIKVESVEVAKVIQTITKLGAVAMLPKRESESGELTPDEMKSIEIIVPLINENNEHQDGYTSITVGDIKIPDSHGAWLFSREKDFPIIVEPELFKSIMMLRLFAENMDIITTEDVE